MWAQNFLFRFRFQLLILVSFVGQWSLFNFGIKLIFSFGHLMLNADTLVARCYVMNILPFAMTKI